MKKVRLLTRIKWKLMNFMRGLRLAWCDWCMTLCYSPELVVSDQYVCRHCISEDSVECECCNEVFHVDWTYDKPNGAYCTDCKEAIFD